MKIKFHWNNLLIVLLAVLFTYFYIYAPETPPNALSGVIEAFQGNFNPQNLIVFVLFNLMGVWPLTMASIVLIDQKSQKIPAWPFVIASFFLGAYALTIYVGLRVPGRVEVPKREGIVETVDRRRNGLILLGITIVLIIWAIISGDWGYYFNAFITNGFIQIMTIDFLLFIVLFPFLLKDDMNRRDYYSPKKFWIFTIIPLFGAIFYIAMRPNIPAN